MGVIVKFTGYICHVFLQKAAILCWRAWKQLTAQQAWVAVHAPCSRSTL